MKFIDFALFFNTYLKYCLYDVYMLILLFCRKIHYFVKSMLIKFTL